MAIKITRGWIKDSLVIFFLAGILFFLMVNISNFPLWQDEAESALNALTITADNIIPREFGREGLPMHECRLYIPKQNDPMYDWYPTAYYYSPYVTTHGWLPYYFIKLGIVLFGRNELGPRFFSPIFFVMFLFTLYKILNRYRGYLIAMLTLTCISFMPNMLTGALQARYFTYTLFFCTLSLFCFLRYFANRSRLNFTLFIMSALFLYYTNLQYFILMSGTYFVSVLLKDRKLIGRYIFAMAICLAGIIPHLVITKFYMLALLLPKDTEPFISGWKCFITTVNHNMYIVTFALLSIILVVGKTILLNAKKDRFADTSILSIFTCCFIVVGFPFICLATPEMSFYERIFLPLAPFMIYAAIETISFYANLLKGKFLRTVAAIALCSLFIMNPVVVGYAKCFKGFFTGKYEPMNISHTDSRWVLSVIDYIKSTGSRNPLILTSFEQFVFTYYSDYDAQLIWPVKKEYIDSMERDLFIVLEKPKYLDEHAGIYYPRYMKELYKDEKNRNYYDRIKRCDKLIIGPVTVYQSLKKF